LKFLVLFQAVFLSELDCVCRINLSQRILRLTQSLTNQFE